MASGLEPITSPDLDVIDTELGGEKRLAKCSSNPLPEGLRVGSIIVLMKVSTKGVLWHFAVWAMMLGSASGQGQPREDFIRTDPEKVMLAEACGECHRSEFAVWKETKHSQVYDDLHRKEAALKIAESMGFHLVKRESLCLKCHYTSVIRRGSLRAAAGVSCESCHGAALDWINLHNAYGVRESDFQKARQLETAAHRAERRRQSEAAGMLRPSNLYAVASNCFQCHTVPHERLVNVGRHSTGSADFELVTWSQKIRHNFLDSFLTADGTTNAERSPNRKRVLYFIGRALDLEYSLRGLTLAAGKGRYEKAMIRRAKNAISEMREISERSSLPESEQILEAVRGVKLSRKNAEVILRSAQTVAAIAQRFLDNQDGSRLASLDPLYSGTREPYQTAQEEGPEGPVQLQSEESGSATSGIERETVSEEPSADPGKTVSARPETVGRADRKPGAAVTGKGEAATSVAREASAPAGRIRRRPSWRERPQHATIGPDKCAGCHRHSAQDEWWLEDKHYTSADPFLEEERKYLQVARLYGLNSAQMKRGNQICMQCHGSIVSGRENREVSIGVGCESCHGPGADFREPHQQEGGYQTALGLGMVALKKPEVRARVCAGCHYITDPRLISVGHPTGNDFDFSQRNSRIRHWEHALASASQLRPAYRRVIAQRGPIPSVSKLLAAGSPTASATGVTAQNRASTGGNRGEELRRDELRSEKQTPGPDTEIGGIGKVSTRPPPGGARSRIGSVRESDRGPKRRIRERARRMVTGTFPTIHEGTPMHEILLLVQERLAQLYRQSATPNNLR